MFTFSSRTFFLYNTDEPADSELLAFLRVFNMEEGTTAFQFCVFSAAVVEIIDTTVTFLVIFFTLNINLLFTDLNIMSN